MISTTMANLLDSVENSIWHAFECLALEGDGTAPKAKLKVRNIPISSPRKRRSP